MEPFKIPLNLIIIQSCIFFDMLIYLMQPYKWNQLFWFYRLTWTSPPPEFHRNRQLSHWAALSILRLHCWLQVQHKTQKNLELMQIKRIRYHIVHGIVPKIVILQWRVEMGKIKFLIQEVRTFSWTNVDVYLYHIY